MIFKKKFFFWPYNDYICQSFLTVEWYFSLFWANQLSPQTATILNVWPDIAWQRAPTTESVVV